MSWSTKIQAKLNKIFKKPSGNRVSLTISVQFWGFFTVSSILVESQRSNSPKWTSVWSSGFFDTPGGSPIVNWNKFWSFSTTSWGCWKHAFWIPGARYIFLNPKLCKESKNRFKTISNDFSKNCFQCKKVIKKIEQNDDFWIFMAIYMIRSDQFSKL